MSEAPNVDVFEEWLERVNQYPSIRLGGGFYDSIVIRNAIVELKLKVQMVSTGLEEFTPIDRLLVAILKTELA